MLLEILFVFMFFFTSKQTYSGRHFTGARKTPKIIIEIASVLNSILIAVYTVYNFTVNGFLHTFVLWVVSFVFLNIANRILSKIAIGWTKKECDIKDNMFFSLFNYKYDIIATLASYVGILVNFVIIIVAFITVL